MANLSYCAFENTCQDLQQILFMLDEADDNDMRLEEFIETRSSPYEKAAVVRIEQLCCDVLDLLAVMRGG